MGGGCVWRVCVMWCMCVAEGVEEGVCGGRYVGAHGVCVCVWREVCGWRVCVEGVCDVVHVCGRGCGGRCVCV